MKHFVKSSNSPGHDANIPKGWLHLFSPFIILNIETKVFPFNNWQ